MVGVGKDDVDDHKETHVFSGKERVVKIDALFVTGIRMLLKREDKLVHVPNPFPIEVILLDKILEEVEANLHIFKVVALLEAFFFVEVKHESKRLAETMAMILLDIHSSGKLETSCAGVSVSHLEYVFFASNCVVVNTLSMSKGTRVNAGLDRLIGHLFLEGFPVDAGGAVNFEGLEVVFGGDRFKKKLDQFVKKLLVHGCHDFVCQKEGG